MSYILVAEDDIDIAELVRHSLERAGHSADIVASGRDVLPSIKQRPPDVLILDLMLPAMNGLEICRALRGQPTTARLPIIIVTARGEETDRIVGLEIGADDYVTKPFSPKELDARVGALIRRAKPAASAEPVLRYGPIEIDADQHIVRSAGRDVRLTAKEFRLLQFLIEHRGRVLSRDRLLTDVWGYAYTGGTRTVDVHIRRLREKLPILAGALETIKQFGYKLKDAP